MIAILMAVCLLFLSTTSATASDLQSLLHRNDTAFDFDATMGMAGTEVMLDDTFMGTAWMYEYTTDDAAMSAAEALFNLLDSNGYAAEEANFGEMPAIRFTKSGQEDIRLAVDTAHPIAYVMQGAFTTDTGYVVVEENGITYYEDVAHQYRTTMGHADIFIDGERISGFTARFSPVLSGTKNLFYIERSEPEYYMSMVLPDGYMTEGGTYNREQFVGTDLNCCIQVGSLYYGYTFNASDEMERFDDITFSFSPVSHDQPVAAQFYIAYNYMGERHSIEGFAVVLHEGASSSGNGSTASGDKCSICHGTGRCQVCQGRGYASYTTWGQGGSGKVTCTSCNGSGKCKYCGK